MSNQISFGNNSKDGSFFSAIKDSVINTGSTALIGGAIGAAGGKIVSAINSHPPTPSEIAFQYGDMFEKTLAGGKVPEYLKAGGDDIVQIAKKGIITNNHIKTLVKTAEKFQGEEAGQKYLEKITKGIFNKSEKLSNLQNEFVQKLSSLKNSNIDDIASKGAAALRKDSVKGAGIAIGVIIALTLNLLKTYGVIGKKEAPPAQTQQTAAP